MLNLIQVEDALKLENTLFIDVRSPAEFYEATIPRAVNIPIFEDEERAHVGTMYKQKSMEQATSLGLYYASAKLPRIYDSVRRYLQEYKNIVIFCWRGGMRSQSVCVVLNMLNLRNIYQLVGGYKAYRRYVIDFLEKKIDKFQFIMVHGLTGVGKTRILNKLKSAGQPVLDLEYLAQNSGSVFGNIVFQGPPPSQKMFESCIFDVLYKLKQNYAFVESESKRIGNVQIPNVLYDRMISGYHILINTSINNRVNIILEDYILNSKCQQDKIKKSITQLKKRLGNEAVEILLNKIDTKEYSFVIKYLIENYYDPFYQYSIKKYEKYDLSLYYEVLSDIIPQLVSFASNIEKQKLGGIK